MYYSRLHASLFHFMRTYLSSIGSRLKVIMKAIETLAIVTKMMSFIFLWPQTLPETGDMQQNRIEYIVNFQSEHLVITQS